MIYANHNFTSNFLNAVGSKDKFMQKDIILDALAKLIYEDRTRKDIIDLLKENGFNVSIKDKHDKIINIISDQVRRKNKHIINGLVNLILKNNATKGFSADDDDSDDDSSSDDTTTSQSNSGSSFPIAQIGSIATSLAGLFTKKSGTEQLNQRVKLATMQNAKATTGFPTWAKITLAVVGVGIVIGIIVYMSKQNKPAAAASAPAAPAS
jgi:hypothetical protein